MRVIGLLPIILLFSSSVFSADRDGLEQSARDISTSGLTLSSPDLDPPSRTNSTSDRRDNVSWGRYRRLQDRRDSFCATMRTYRVAREERGSDATKVVGYARCLPAWKFQLRTADKKFQESSR